MIRKGGTPGENTSTLEAASCMDPSLDVSGNSQQGKDLVYNAENGKFTDTAIKRLQHIPTTVRRVYQSD
ncbi:MAG: hypothetical protein WCH39_21175 [Schlesneria sp.]